ncbi:MAG: hypothetical protein H7A51_15445 [Akkermansiaceae bacterium]|nr:hypothetical protein [Akkermansiaceae bacterium]
MSPQARKLALTLGLLTFASITPFTVAEMHTFTNTEGKSIEAEIVGVSSGKVSLKMKGGKIYTLPFTSLSESDQAYIKDWHAQNKSNVNPGDLSLTVTKKSARVRVPRDKEKSKQGASTKLSIQEVSYQFKLSQRKATPIENIVVYSQIIKRTTTRGDDAGDPEYKEIVDVKEIESLSSKKPEEWETTPESCEDVSTKSKTASSSSKQDVIGVIVTVSAGGKELFKKYEPSTFEKELERIQEKNPEVGQSKQGAKPEETPEEPAGKKAKKKKKAAKKKAKEEKKEEDK